MIQETSKSEDTESSKMSVLLESLDDPYSFRRIEPKIPNIIYDEWEFEVGNTIHVVRFVRVNAKEVGKKVTKVVFGVKRGKTVRAKLTVSNIRKYLATILAIFEEVLENPTIKMKPKMDGIILSMGEETFEMYGKKLLRILKLNLRGKMSLHKNYFEISDDGMKGFYLWKLGKQFKTVFANVDTIQDDIPDLDVPVEPKKKIDITKKIKDISIDNETPIIDTQKKKSSSISVVERQEYARKKGGKDFSAVFTNEEINKNVLEVAIKQQFFETAYKQPKYIWGNKENTTSLITYEEGIYDKNTIKNMFLQENKRGLFLNVYEYLIVLNANGIKTDHIYDQYKSYKYDSIFDIYKYTKEYQKLEIAKKLIENKPSNPRKNLKFEDVMNVVNNAESFLKKHNLYISEAEKLTKNAYHTKDISTGKTPSHFLELFSADEKEDLLYDFLSTLDKDLDDVFQWREDGDGKKKKIIKRTKYSSELGTKHNYMQALGQSVLKNNYKNPRKFLEINSILPRYVQDSNFIDDPELFETEFVSGWAMSGGSSQQEIAHNVLNDYSVNNELPAYWCKNERLDNDYVELLKNNKDTAKRNFDAIYRQTQDFYRNKFGKKYEDKTVKLYRGVGASIVDTYVPGALESWSLQLSTAKKFANMMSKNSKDYCVLTAEVPIQDIWATWESLVDTWPDETTLKGKKEYIVMGGTFATNPIYLFDIVEKEISGKLKSFESFVRGKSLLSESEKMKQLIIKTPADKDFRSVEKNKKTAFGNDPKEKLIQKSVDKSKE